ncbi:hypothetical protein VA249_18290 [Vibrio alfacsensis]|nr:hypothetical protein VA249_18290 [Vibrio alfacsensis]
MMKRTVVASSILLSVLVSPLALAEHMAESKRTTEDLNATIEALKETYSTAELLTALNEPVAESTGFHGNIGTNMELERVIRDDGVNEGKLKYTLAQGSFRHDNLPGWDFGFYSGREELFNGNTKHASYVRGVNSIQEIWANKAFSFERGTIGLGGKLAMESIDERIQPGVKVFGSYRLTDSLSFNAYALYHVEYKRGAGTELSVDDEGNVVSDKFKGEFPYWEIEPGVGYQLSDNSGVWLNLRLQQGKLSLENSANTRETETEQIIKPGIWYSWGRASASLWGEFGRLEKEDTNTGAHVWTEDYNKIGISANYSINKSWNMFGEVSYKDIKFSSGPNKDQFDGYIPLFIAGINYNF